MIGKILSGRYEILEQIGGGGMALVYKAKCQLLDRFVAIKVLKDEFVNDDEFVRKFRRESQAAASLSHPNIVNIYDVGVENDGNNQIYYIVMEYIKGKTLKEIIKEKNKLSIENTLEYSYQIAGALENAHKNGIVHRDIKPHNIMITEDNRVKVTDFGIARAVTNSTVTTTSNVLGSVHYFSPEQARGGYTDEKSDIYSLGIVMYEMVTGQLPYQGESPITVALKHVQEDIKPPRELNSSIPVTFENIILKCVQKRQADRYSNITELIKDIKRVEDNIGDFSMEDTNNYDSHTKIIPAINVEDVDTMKKTKDIKQVKKPKKKDSGGKMVFLGILLAFLLATSIFFGYFRLKNFFVAGDLITVPDLRGKQEEVAKKEVEDLGLQFKVVARVKNSEFKAGEVISQNEDPDSKVKKDYPIEVTISEGDNLVKVPNVVNKPLAEAESMLNDEGLKVDLQYENSDTVPENTVIRQEPNSGESVETGTRITLIISQGEEVKSVIMPKYTGKNIEEVKKDIVKLGLVVGEVREEPNDNLEKGIVIWQSYNQGTTLETKTAVDLYVSSGPIGDTDNDNGDNDDNNESGNKESPITFTLTLHQDREETRIKIIRIQEGISKIVHEKTYKADEGIVTLTLQGKKGSQFEVYYDDMYQDTIPKNE
ncbi:Stk1 family PASTA domain-containing Ser/Thr kinase [Tissierella pigra]|uniref:non-specific serine/threonine protein kinase n=1 Tax=Tissierella pigra TaxID=2607614 RepID=A0A6N7XW99_9FIRM|nr:Stk1 family PASTA domain-containing Ser/Thr kinase [Tissierella pigra]MBU5426483.1 Stk1 family PASTA domain-containing Ser/Thr kinase [Tissierella pigra]MSU00070.1 Stk1 family PASTA domain-containing Ser/Thr kinase [Tissierella pigra]